MIIKLTASLVALMYPKTLSELGPFRRKYVIWSEDKQTVSHPHSPILLHFFTKAKHGTEI